MGRKQCGAINLVVPILVLFLSCGPCWASWIKTGSPGVNVQRMYCGPSNEVYLATNGGIFRTTDGSSWSYSGLRFPDTDSIAGRAACSNTVYANAGNSLYQSTDMGETWGLFTSVPADVDSLTISLPPYCVGYAGTNDGVRLSNGRHGLAGHDVTSLAVNPNNHVFAVTENLIFKTNDQGQSWSKLPKFTDKAIFSLKIDGAGRMFAGTLGDGVYRSTDGGRHWTKKNFGLPSVKGYPGFRVVLTLAKDSLGVLYAGVATKVNPLSGAVYKSSDNGESWTATNSVVNKYSVQAMCTTPDNTLYAGTSHGVFKTTDQGVTWLDMTNAFNVESFGNAFAMTPGPDDQAVFAGSEGGGVYKSTDNGATWKQVGAGDPNSINDLLTDSDGNVYAAGRDIAGVYKSSDGGLTWAFASNGLPTATYGAFTGYIDGQALGMDGTGKIYAGLDNGTVYKTEDLGGNWSTTGPLPFASEPQEILALTGHAGSTILAASKSEIFKSPDGGASWAKITTGLPWPLEIVKNSFYHDAATGDIYMGVMQGIYRSGDGGSSWTRLSLTPDTDQCMARSFAIDKWGRLYAVVCDGIILASPDKGATWQDIGQGLIPPGGDPLEGLRLSGVFAAPNGNLVLASENSGMYLRSALTAPNGGEVIPAGSVYSIKWTAFSDAVKYKLRYSLDGGVKWSAAHPGYIRGSSYDWPVPVPANNKPNCLVKVMAYNSSNVHVGEDTSDHRFAITVAKLTYPGNAGIVLTSGEKATIRWKTFATIRPVTKVELFYTLNGGTTWSPINMTGDPANDGSFAWTVKAVTASKPNCKIQVVLRDAAGKIVGSDLSDKPFTIRPAP